MTNHPNRGWRKRWTVDAARREARHGPTGLVVRFEPHPDGSHEGTSPNGPEVFAALRAEYGADEAVRRIARLMRESGEIYAQR